VLILIAHKVHRLLLLLLLLLILIAH